MGTRCRWQLQLPATRDGSRLPAHCQNEQLLAAATRDTRATLPPLGDGPRRDLNAIAARYGRSSPVLRKAARDVYDSYLKATRIEEGIANYDSVLQLMLGTTLGGDWGQK